MTEPLSRTTAAEELVYDLSRYVEYAESSGNPNAVSRMGATGLMGIMPNTGMTPGYQVSPISPRDLMNPEKNLRFGREYLGAMLDKYGNVDHALAAYNWGPGNVDKWISQGSRLSKLPQATKDYVDGWKDVGKHAVPKKWQSWEERN